MVEKVRVVIEVPETGEVYTPSWRELKYSFVVLDSYSGLSAWGLPTHSNIVTAKHNDDGSIIRGIKDSTTIESILKLSEYVGKIEISDEEISVTEMDEEQLNDIAKRVYDLVNSK